MSKLERCIYSTKQMHTKVNAKHTIQTMMGAAPRKQPCEAKVKAALP